MEGYQGRRRSEIDTWRNKYRSIWDGATRHPFILSIADGSIDISAFKTWLGQDYIFVRAFVAFVASLVVKAWRESRDDDVEVILSGLSSLKDEIEWFKRESTKWGVNLDHLVPMIQNQDYCRFLESLMSTDVDYTVAITAFWTIETVYQVSFSACLGDEVAKTPVELQETCQRWGNDAFANYCLALESIVGNRLETAPLAISTEAELVFRRVLRHEIEFWDMSRGDEL